MKQGSLPFDFAGQNQVQEIAYDKSDAVDHHTVEK